MKDQVFRATLGVAVVAGTGMSYFSLLAGATYTAVMIRTSVAVAVIGLIGWLVALTVSKPPTIPESRSSGLADILDQELKQNEAIASSDPHSLSLEEGDEKDDLHFEPLDSGLARAL